MSPISLLVGALLALLPFTTATRLIESKSLNPCLANSSLSATLFHVIFTPDNKTLTFNIVGVSTISGNVTIELEVIAYGYTAMRQQLNPCDSKDLDGMCPMNAGPLNIGSNIPISDEVIKSIPGMLPSL